MSSTSSAFNSPNMKSQNAPSAMDNDQARPRTPADIEDAIITKRVKYADDEINGCIDLFYKFYDTLNDSDAEEETIAEMQGDLLEKLEWYQLKVQMERQLEVTLERDIGIYQKRLDSLETEREQIINNIGDLQQQLEKAKVDRDHQEEYNVMIAQINKEPPRDVTSAALDEMQQKLDAVNRELSACTQEVKRRSNQCYAAFSAVQALKRSITEPDSGGGKEEMDEDDDVKMQ